MTASSSQREKIPHIHSPMKTRSYQMPQLPICSKSAIGSRTSRSTIHLRILRGFSPLVLFLIIQLCLLNPATSAPSTNRAPSQLRGSKTGQQKSSPLDRHSSTSEEGSHNSIATALMHSLQATSDLVGFTLALSQAPKEEPEPVEIPNEIDNSGYAIGIWICIVLALSFVGLCIFGVCKLIQKCKAKFSRETQTEIPVVPTRPRFTRTTTPPQRRFSLSCPFSKGTTTDTSTCSTRSSSPRAASGIPRPVVLFQQRPPLPPVVAPKPNVYEAPLPMTIRELCLQQYAAQQSAIARTEPSHENAPPSKIRRLLCFWKRG